MNINKKLQSMIGVMLLTVCVICALANARSYDRLHGSWEAIFDDDFDGAKTLEEKGWVLSNGPTDANYIVEQVGGKLRMVTYRTSLWVWTEQYFPIGSIPTEFCVKNLEHSSSEECGSFYVEQNWVFLQDTTGSNRIDINYEASNRKFKVVIRENGVDTTLMSEEFWTNYSPTVSIVLTDETLDVWSNGRRVNFGYYDSTNEHSYRHNFSSATLAGGFRIYLKASKSPNPASTCTEYFFERVTVARPYAATEPVTVNVGSTVLKSNLESNNFCAVNWDYNREKNQMREIFDNPTYYAEFVDFLQNDTAYTDYRYPGGGSVQWFFPGFTRDQWHNAMVAFDNTYTGDSPDAWIEIEEFFQFLEDSNSTTTLQLNTWNWFDSDANEIVGLAPYWGDAGSDDANAVYLAEATAAVGNLAQWIVDNGHADRVTAFELGNEDYYNLSAIAYAQISAAFMQEVNSVIPNAKFIITLGYGPGDGGGQNADVWTGNVIDELVSLGAMGLVDGLCPHYYGIAFNDPEKDDYATAYQVYAAMVDALATEAGRNPANGSLSMVEMFKQVPAAKGYGNLPLYFTEYRLGGLFGEPKLALAGGLGILHFAADMLSSPEIAGASIFNLTHGARARYGNEGLDRSDFGAYGYHTIEYMSDEVYDMNAIGARFTTTPVSQSFKFIEKLAKGNIVNSNSSKDLVYTLATRKDNKLRVLVFNEYAQPEDEYDVIPNFWGYDARVLALETASAAADRFAMTLNLPNDLPPQLQATVYTLGITDIDRLETSSAVLLSTAPVVMQVEDQFIFTGNTIDYHLAPHSAYLFEFEAPACGSQGYLESDFNKDCKVNFEDIKILLDDWLVCNIPGQAGCDTPW